MRTLPAFAVIMVAGIVTMSARVVHEQSDPNEPSKMCRARESADNAVDFERSSSCPVDRRLRGYLRGLLLGRE